MWNNIKRGCKCTCSCCGEGGLHAPERNTGYDLGTSCACSKNGEMPSRTNQMIYLAIRAFMTLFFFVFWWYGMGTADDGVGGYYRYLTNLSYFILIVYLLLTLFLTGRVLYVDPEELKKPSGLTTFTAHWGQMATVYAWLVFFFYWVLIYDGSADVYSFVAHGVNAIWAGFDLGFGGMWYTPFALVYIFGFGIFYLVCYIIYEEIDGTSIYDGISHVDDAGAFVVSVFQVLAGAGIFWLFCYCCTSGLRAVRSPNTASVRPTSDTEMANGTGSSSPPRSESKKSSAVSSSSDDVASSSV